MWALTSTPVQCCLNVAMARDSSPAVLILLLLFMPFQPQLNQPPD
jgi:hypothetical protein